MGSAPSSPGDRSPPKGAATRDEQRSDVEVPRKGKRKGKRNVKVPTSEGDSDEETRRQSKRPRKAKRSGSKSAKDKEERRSRASSEELASDSPAVDSDSPS